MHGRFTRDEPQLWQSERGRSFTSDAQVAPMHGIKRAAHERERRGGVGGVGVGFTRERHGGSLCASIGRYSFCG